MKNIIYAFMVLVLTASATAQQDEMQLMDDVARLQQQLKSANVKDRDSAEKELLAIGEFALDHLEIVDPADPTDYRTRLARVRTALEKVAVEKVTEPARLTFENPKLSIDELLTEIKKQTGNDVILGKQVSVEKGAMQVTIEGEEVEFWDVLTQLMDQADLRLDPYDGELGQLALADSAVQNGGELNNETEIESSFQFSDNSGVMRFDVTRVDAARNFQNPNLSYGSFSMTLQWEPRLRPIAIDLPLSSIEMVDEFDRVYQMTKEDGGLSRIVQPTIPQLDFNIRTPLFDRQIEELKSIKGTVEAILPGRIETFKFKNISKVIAGTEQTKAGATVGIDGIQKNEDLWGVQVTLSFDEENNALESHQSWVFNNEIYLVDAEGNKEYPIGRETYQQTNEMVGIQYFFGEDPGDRELHYRTPAAVVKVKIPFIFKGIPLP